MSYLVLARKYRPQTFADVVGQKPVVRTLQNALARDRVSHAMLFSGVRGVGKTTLARIMAKALNCSRGPTPSPCNACEFCRAIAEGTAIDLHEIDGASNRGIQEIRELKENIRFFPTHSRYKIIIIDEVHMLTTEAFNALLKTLEEPPEHVFFMFATTEQHKIPITILSRCQRYELSRIASRDLADFFQKVATAEKVVIFDRALAQIVREADGSVRDGLSLLDQVFSFADAKTDGGDVEVADEDVVQMLGLIDSRTIATLAAALLRGDLAASITTLDEVCAHGSDLKRFTNDLLIYFRSLLICRMTDKPAELLDLSDQDLADMKQLAGSYEPETLHGYFQLLMKGVEAMQYSKHPKLMLEMAFMQSMQAGRIVPVAELLGRLDGLLQEGSPALGAEAPTAEGLKARSGTGTVKQPESEQHETPAGMDVPKKKGNDESVPEVNWSGPADAPRDIRKNWQGFINYVMERKKWMAMALKLNSGLHEEQGLLSIKFDQKADCKMLQTDEHLKTLSEFAQDFFQRKLRITIKVRDKDKTENDASTAGAVEERRLLANDPLVQMTTDIFDGQVTNIRIGPRGR
jgi:DNA polymerase-3 subunit gamma/tau